MITGWVLAYALSFAFNRPIEFDTFTGSYLPLVFFLLSGVAVYVTVRSGVREGDREALPVPHPGPPRDPPLSRSLLAHRARSLRGGSSSTSPPRLLQAD
ncbi:hypothetical protein [Methanoculleus chikugoensis]|uniref:hypothetical protein n=1 Tax=Methanoculleus chikugoensis TaxID=118126 RepID=UPI001FB1B2A5|nr:hypothetical protein [Methanoculleus chikugoensis]